jgi:hypothetical protein
MSRFLLAATLLASGLSTALFVSAGAPVSEKKASPVESGSRLTLLTPNVTCVGRYREAIETRFHEIGVRELKIEFLPHAPEHGPAGPLGGHTAKVTVSLGKQTKARELAAAIRDLDFSLVE